MCVGVSSLAPSTGARSSFDSILYISFPARVGILFFSNGQLNYVVMYKYCRQEHVFHKCSSNIMGCRMEGKE